MKVHAIKTGVVSVKTKQRQGVGSVARRINTLLDHAWTEWLPIYCWVIEHPEGLIVVDTGETSRATRTGYFPQWHPYFRNGVKMRVDPEEEIGPQIKKLGLSPNDVRWVIMTHLHTDHAGGISHFPRSEFLVSRTELKMASGLAGKLRGYLPDHLPEWFAPRSVDYRAGDYGAFATGYTVTERGDVYVVPTPGHTIGHQSVILRDGNRSCVFAGDTSYTEGLMLEKAVDGVSPKAPLAKRTLDRIQNFLQREPAVYLPSHDPESAERLIHHRPTVMAIR